MGEILHSDIARPADPHLLVGNETHDDAAVLDLGDGTAVVSTTDFFLPIVDDPRDFGRIASVNAMSDVYAMGGRPIMAIAILGWPAQLEARLAHDVIEGARDACQEAGITLAGGHSIDNPEPIFGLAVTGRVKIEHLKKNAGAQTGDLLFLTKPLGVGILTTAEKKGSLKPEHAQLVRDIMVQLNDIGEEFGTQAGVHAMTDVTGFGLLGHLLEMCDAANLSADIKFADVPRVEPDILTPYIEARCVPGGTSRNWESYGKQIHGVSEPQRKVLCDPQTSGGLLVAVDPAAQSEFVASCAERQLSLKPFGVFRKRDEFAIYVS